MEKGFQTPCSKNQIPTASETFRISLIIPPQKNSYFLSIIFLSDILHHTKTMSSVTITYLEMRDSSQLCPKTTHDPRFRVVEIMEKNGELNRSLYILVGEAWAWRDKLAWSEEQWKAYAESVHLKTFVAYVDEEIAGYFELMKHEDSVEIAYFGLAPDFIGQGLGGVLLTQAIEAAWQLEPSRVWVHTCTLDHPAALRNYLSRGMTIYDTQQQ
jgi:GNAT superfamily N-acetyltransferase